MTAGQQKGFDIDYDPVRHVLTLRFLGILDRGLARQCDRQFHKRVRAIHASDGEWYLVLDFTRCVPMSDDVQEIIRHAVEFARQQGMCNKAIVTNGTIVGFRPTSLAGHSEMPVDFYFQSEADAVRWLLDEPLKSATNGQTTRSHAAHTSRL